MPESVPQAKRANFKIFFQIIKCNPRKNGAIYIMLLEWHNQSTEAFGPQPSCNLTYCPFLEWFYCFVRLWLFPRRSLDIVLFLLWCCILLFIFCHVTPLGSFGRRCNFGLPFD